MQKIGYSLVEVSTGDEIMTALALPCRFSVPGVGVVDFDQPGQVMPDSAAPTHIFVERWADTAPSPSHTLASETPTYDDFAGRVEVIRTWNDPPAPTVEHLKEYAAAKRYEVEIGGITIPGDPPMPCWTDRATQAFLSRILESIERNFVAAPLKIKTPAGSILMTLEQIEGIAALVAQHVQACFDLEADISDDIDAETITSFSEIDAAAWPGA